MAAPAGAPAGTAPRPSRAAGGGRRAHHGDLVHARRASSGRRTANNATSHAVDGGSEVTFTAGKNKYVGTINAQNQVARVQTWIDNPVLGDTLVETTFSDYRDFAGVRFPGHIVRTQGGHPVLDLTVADVKANPAVDAPVPESREDRHRAPGRRRRPRSSPTASTTSRAGTHHSVAIDQADHVVVVEGPQTEARSLAVIAKVKETIPNKPIKYLINTHVHFDHSGGLRTWVDEGATIVTHEMNKPYYEQAWAAPHTLNPDKLAAVQEERRRSRRSPTSTC